ncbi:MAG: PorP/SprF family type IX secretion system membrane protein [Salibacteraceae bacterium]
MRALIYISIFLLASSSVFGQGIDPQFSLYGRQPLTVNPALTGNMESKWRIGTNIREQDFVVSQPYRSGVASFDINLPINAWSGNIWGFGLYVVHDDQGDARLRNTQVNGSFSLGQYLDPREQHSLSVGLQAGMGQRSIGYGNVYWDNQWANEGFDLQRDPNENLPGGVKKYLDISTGLQYSYYGDIMQMTGGYAMYHANTPDNSLYIDTNQTQLDRRHTIHFTMENRLRKDNLFALRPSFLFTNQGKINNLIVGNDFVFYFNEPTRVTGKRKEYSMSLGIYHRLLKDMVATLQFDLAGFSFGAAYDIAVGSMNQLNGYQGGYEIFVGYRAGFRSGSNSRYMPHKKGKL